MYDFCYDYINPKYGEKAKLCYMNPVSFVANIKTEDTYKDISEDVEKRFDTSNYEIDKLLHIEKNEKVIELMKDELGWQIIKKLIGLRPKTYSYLKDNNDESKKAKSAKRCVIKRKLKFEDYKKYFETS